MTIGKRRDAWERTARLVVAWTGESWTDVMPSFGEQQPKRQDVLPYNEALRAEIVRQYEGSN